MIPLSNLLVALPLIASEPFPADSNWTIVEPYSENAVSVDAMTEYQGQVAAAWLESAETGGMTSVAVLDGDHWTRLGGVFPGYVRALEVVNGKLIAGGAFSSNTESPGVELRYIAQWDGGAWTPIGGQLSGSVTDIVELNGNLYVSGYFSLTPGVLFWDGVRWNHLFNSSQGSHLFRGVALAVYNGEIVAAGNGRSIPGGEITDILRWTGSGWDSFNTSTTSGVVTDIQTYKGYLCASTDTPSEGGNQTLSVWNGAFWTSLGLAPTPNDGPGNAMTIYDDRLILGGGFRQVDVRTADRIAAWDGSNWTNLGSGISGSGPPDFVDAMASVGGYLYVGGRFEIAGGKVSPLIARWHSPDVEVPIVVTFSAESARDGVHIHWSAPGNDAGTSGFQIYRELPGAARQPVGPFHRGGDAEYEFVDEHPDTDGIAWWIAEIRRDGATSWHGPIRMETLAGGARPIHLGQNTPNPCRGATRIDFDLDRADRVTLTMFDALGRAVTTLLDEAMPSGHHELHLDRRALAMAPGVYFYRLETSRGRETRKLVLQP